ncbi:diadenylate cyclase CdaA [Proteiniclasticum sp. SCR006]|uniref:Diadenylate cyclase n=1 Tax=Proteiniclasticum aestuarii TaxID=2817862 RepID=A0A939HAH0_9CLOT|nr:diadenylate cyclase CdaA [Proteiniclasticum aestuarii]MBO1264730.1 diadenylate cyclase CdaA [Proteiniclasticum aestuarii]
METLNTILNTVRNINISSVIDILIVAYLIYRMYKLIIETRAELLLRGIILILLLIPISYIFNLTMVYTIISKTITIGVLTLVIIFQPEIRRMLEHIGRSAFSDRRVLRDTDILTKVVNEIVAAMDNLSKTKTGALIVIEQDTGLGDISETGIRIDALVSTSLLENIFVPNTPLHDGATIIRGDRIMSSGCVLPLTTNKDISKKLGTRHRAALGLSEVSDSLILIVSEETGTISLALNGKLVRNYDRDRLQKILVKILTSKIQKKQTWKERMDQWLSKKDRTSS